MTQVVVHSHECKISATVSATIPVEHEGSTGVMQPQVCYLLNLLELLSLYL